MPIKNWSVLCALVLVAQVFSLGALPFELFEPWDRLFHVLAYAALTLMLWIALDGARPTLVVAGVMALALGDELRQGLAPARAADLLDFLCAAAAVIATAAVLHSQSNGAKKPCAESSAR